jgi:hypothetical protein
VSSKKKMDVEDRFIAFAKTLPGAEYIDEIDLTREQKEARKADFLFDNRRIICELKSLKTDTGGKVEKILEPHKERPEWPIFFGTVGVQQILKHLPDGQQINRQIFDAVTSAIKDLTRSANGQIRRTKETFNLPSAGGMLVILNEFIDILSPDVIARRLDELFRKRNPDGTPQFPEINAVLIINESHYTQVTPDLQGIPALIMTNPMVPDLVDATGYISSLQPKWAEYHGVPLVTMKGGVLDEVKFESIKKAGSRPDGKIRRQDMWRRQYRLRPYLQSLSKQELIEYFGRLMSAMKPGLLKGGSEEQKAKMREMMEPWTHLLEEINRRGMDMREFSPVMKGPDSESVAATTSNSRTAYGGKVGRNEPCPCGSGKKYKKCCGNATAADEERGVMIKRDIQGPVTVESHTGGTAIARINFYALSIVASRVFEGNVYIDHAASYAPAPINSEEEAYDYGMKEAMERWPAGEGWSHRVDVKLVELKFEFGNKGAA